MRRFIPFLFATVALLVAFRLFATFDGAALIRAKLAKVDWRVVFDGCDEPTEAAEVTT